MAAWRRKKVVTLTAARKGNIVETLDAKWKEINVEIMVADENIKKCKFGGGIDREKNKIFVAG